MAKNPLSRRRFIQLGTGAVAATTVAKNILQPRQLYAAPRRVAPSDTVRFASIGTGIRGSFARGSGCSWRDRAGRSAAWERLPGRTRCPTAAGIAAATGRV